MNWEQTRAVTALLEIARDSLQAASAVAPDGRVVLQEAINEARAAADFALRRASVDLATDGEP